MNSKLSPEQAQTDWKVLQTWLDQDTQGQELLKWFQTDPSSIAGVLAEWLRSHSARMPSQLATYVSSGQVDRLINIAQAGIVLIQQTPIPTPIPTPQKMRVCFISSEYPPHLIGGLGAHVEELTKALGEHLSVDVVLPAIPPRSEEEYKKDVPGVQLHKTGIPASYSDAASWINFSSSAAEIIRDMEPKPQVIHCHDWVTVLAGIDCRQRLKVPLLFHLHLPNRSPLCASIENLGLVYADRVTVNSKAAYWEIATRTLGINRKIKIINNGVNVARFKPCEDWPHDDGYILFVGRLVEQKGAAYLLHAFSYVIEK